MSTLPQYMLNHFVQRTLKHIQRVQKNIELLVSAFPLLDPVVMARKSCEHDLVKFREPELTPYIWMTEKYRRENLKLPELEISDDLQKQMDQAVQHHYKSCPHHPENHSDITGMSLEDIAEMVADWHAMSQEFGSSTKTWADNNIEKRWKFSPEQKDIIYQFIAILEPCVGTVIGKLVRPTRNKVRNFLDAGKLYVFFPDPNEEATQEPEDRVPFRGVQLAGTYKIGGNYKWPMWIEPKIDGARILVIFQKGEGTAYTRSGNTYSNLIGLLSAVGEDFPDGVIDCEVFLKSWGETMSALRGRKEKHKKSLLKAKLYAFDFLTLDEYRKGGSSRPYSERKKDLKSKTSALRRIIKIIPHKVVKSPIDVDKAYKNFLNMGYEGAMLKDPKGIYRVGYRSDDWLKIKPFVTVEARIIGVLEGKGKHLGRLGAFEIQLLDSGTQARVGTGFDDKQRDVFWKNRKKMIGTIIEVKIQEGDISARHPSFVRLRPDR